MTKLEIVHTESSCGWGGQELRIIEESAGFIGSGHHVTIAAPRESRIIVEAQKRAVPVVEMPIAQRSIGGLLAMRQYLSSRHVDIVNTHSSTDSWLASLSMPWRSGAPKIVRTRHVSAPITPNWASRWLYRRAAHVVTTGAALRLQLLEETGLGVNGVTSVPTGIDLRRFCPGDRNAARAMLGIPMEIFLIGVVATLRSWKGHKYLVEAFAALQDKRSRLLMVGDGPGNENLRRQVAELGISDRVQMPGNQADVVPWLRALDLFILPSYANEGVPQAIMQAQACGIPVISTAVGSINEIVAHEGTGLLVEPRDAVGLSEAIVRLRNDPSLRVRLAGAALAQAQARYPAAIMIDRMQDIFSSVMAQGSA